MAQNHVDYGVVKKPGEDSPLTKKEAEEWVKCADDPWYFFTNYCYVIGPKGKTLFNPRDYQIELLDQVYGNRFVIVNAPRQCGKTAVMGLYALHEAIFNEDLTIGITSYKGSNVKDFMKRIKYAYENLPNFLKPPVKTYNVTEVEFTHNSIIYAEVTTESALRGKTVTGTAIIDEFAFCKPLVADEFMTSFLPALEAAGEDSQTKVVIISTPNSSTGKYAETVFGAIEGSNGWVYHKVDHNKIPGRTEAWRNKMIKKLGKNKFKQEFEGAFLSDNSSLINSSILEAIENITPVRSLGDLDIFVDSFQGRHIALACDVSEGIGKDNHAIQFIDIHTFEQVAEYANNTLNQTQYFKKIVRFLHFLYDEGAVEVYFTVENNGLGNGILRLIENSEDAVFSKAMMINDVDKDGNFTGRMGLYTTNRTKLEGCTQLKDLVEEGKLRIYSEKLLNELRMFTKHGSTFKAETGAKDDRVMAFVVLMNMLKVLASFDESIFDTLNQVTVTVSDDGDWADVYF